MYDSLPSAASDSPHTFELASRVRVLARKPDPQPEWTIHPLRCLYVREDNYWPQALGDDVTSEDLRPILIANELLLTGGFAGGMKVGDNINLELVYFDEHGRPFECLSGSRRQRVANFLSNGFVRIRLFSDIYWRLDDVPPLRNEAFHGHVVLAVTDIEGDRHYFTFPVTAEIRDLFPPFLAEVT